MRTPSTSGDCAEAAAHDPEILVRLLNDMAKKIDGVTQSTSDLKAEVGAIKARLFNGLTDTMRETYAKVIILENKQEETTARVLDIQRNWIEKFTSHDTRERLFHSIIGIIMAFILITFSIMVVYKLQGNDAISLFVKEQEHITSSVPALDYGWSLVGP